MARPAALGTDAITELVEHLRGWRHDDGALRVEYRFDSFAAAFGFMAAVATEAAALDHHPDWSNSYSSVKIALRTHDVAAITELDAELARRIDALAGAADIG